MGPFLKSLTGRPKKPDPTAERILAAGMAELMEFGFRRTTIDDVARRAGVVRMTVYRRFPAKEALMQAIAARQVREFMLSVDRAVAPDAPIGDRLVEGFVVTVGAIRKNRLLGRMMSSDPEATMTVLTVKAEPALALARSYLAAFIRANVKTAGRKEADWAAESVLRLLQSFAVTRGSAIPLDDPEGLRDYARKFVLPLILGKNG